jgi:hypothetical protein
MTTATRTEANGCSRLMICPNNLTCDRNDDGIGEHCGRHAEAEGCAYGADGCPPCVPSANAPHQARRDSGVALNAVVDNSGGQDNE